jgi:putative sigma-54 modulation protein
MNDKIIISGVHLDLTEALKNSVEEKMEKLFRHENKIIRVRVDLEHAHNSSHENEFVAKGHIDINGSPIVVSVGTEDLYKSIDELSIKLDRQLRRRSRLARVKRKDIHEIDLNADLPKAASI